GDPDEVRVGKRWGVGEAVEPAAQALEFAAVAHRVERAPVDPGRDGLGHPHDSAALSKQASRYVTCVLSGRVGGHGTNYLHLLTSGGIMYHAMSCVNLSRIGWTAVSGV